MERKAVSRILAILALTGALLSACRVSTEATREEQITELPKQTGGATFFIRGTMRFVDVEGGCWQLISADDRFYELMGANAESLYIDGIHVELEVRRTVGQSSICQVGDLVEIVRIIRVTN